MRTDHSDAINQLNANAERTPDRLARLGMRAAAELLSCHDDTGISLDDWDPVREFVEAYLEQPIQKNGA